MSHSSRSITSSSVVGAWALWGGAAPSSGSTYLAMTSTSRLTGSPTLLDAERGQGEGLGDEADGEACPSRGLDDGQADAVDGDRALVDEVAGEVGRQRDLDDLPVLARGAGEDLAGAVDVALDDVAAEPGSTVGALEVDPGARGEAAQRGLVEGLLHDVGGDRPPSRSATVRQQPLTAIESPSPAPSMTMSAADGEPDGVVLVDVGDVPSSSTMPVNIRPPLSGGSGGMGVMVSRTWWSSPWPEHVHVGDVQVPGVGDGGDAEVGDGGVPAPSSIGAT